jgi:hypothetical protein
MLSVVVDPKPRSCQIPNQSHQKKGYMIHPIHPRSQEEIPVEIHLLSEKKYNVSSIMLARSLLFTHYLPLPLKKKIMKT